MSRAKELRLMIANTAICWMDSCCKKNILTPTNFNFLLLGPLLKLRHLSFCQQAMYGILVWLSWTCLCLSHRSFVGLVESQFEVGDKAKGPMNCGPRWVMGDISQNHPLTKSYQKPNRVSVLFILLGVSYVIFHHHVDEEQWIMFSPSVGQKDGKCQLISDLQDLHS